MDKATLGPKTAEDRPPTSSEVSKIKKEPTEDRPPTSSEVSKIKKEPTEDRPPTSSELSKIKREPTGEAPPEPSKVAQASAKGPFHLQRIPHGYQEARAYYATQLPPFLSAYRGGKFLYPKAAQKSTTVILAENGKWPEKTIKIKAIARSWDIEGARAFKHWFYTLDLNSNRLIIKKLRTGKSGYHVWTGVASGFSEDVIAYDRRDRTLNIQNGMPPASPPRPPSPPPRPTLYPRSTSPRREPSKQPSTSRSRPPSASSPSAFPPSPPSP